MSQKKKNKSLQYLLGSAITVNAELGNRQQVVEEPHYLQV